MSRDLLVHADLLPWDVELSTRDSPQGALCSSTSGLKGVSSALCRNWNPARLTQVLGALCLVNDKRQARLVDQEMRRRRINPDM